MEKEKMKEELFLYDNRIEGGLFRLRITNRCNGKCKFCGQHLWPDEVNKLDMPSEWFYEYCRPIYEKIHILLVTGGDALIAPESYNFMKFISEQYPKITIMTESNGINLNQKFRELMSENLFFSHFSINASNSSIFQKSCWGGLGGAAAYQKMMDNLWAYHELLKQKGLECFAPSLSMVINENNAEDIEDFVKLALKLQARHVMFYFDYTESDMTGKNFGKPETSRPALQKLMELERVLAGKFFLYFRLWIPGNEAGSLQEQVESMSLGYLQDKYSSFLELAKNRSMDKEHEQRNQIRRERGKSELAFDEDFTPTIRMTEIGGKMVCSSPWNMLDLYPTGRLDFCGWFRETLNIKNYIKNGMVNWNEILESQEFRQIRKNILNNNYSGCQNCCPLNNVMNEITPVHKFGYERNEK